MAGYVGVYLSSTVDLDWYLKTSLDRLCLQLLPMLIVSLMLYLGSGSENAGKKPERQGKKVSEPAVFS